MMIKIDLEKAYDRLRWEFVHDTLPYANVLEQIIGLIVVVRGAVVRRYCGMVFFENFFPSRGVRQGDPLSLYIFIIFISNSIHFYSQEKKINSFFMGYFNANRQSGVSPVD